MKYVHSGGLGDIIASLPTVRSLEADHGTGDITFYLRPNVPADYYPGCVHPSGKTLMSVDMAKSIRNLLAVQPGFVEVNLWQGQHVDVDLDWFRHTGLRDGSGTVPRWYFYAFEAHADLSKPWLTVEPDETYRGRLVVARTFRYRNPAVAYHWLNQHKPLFVGLPDEFEDFKKDCPDAEYADTPDLLASARVIAASGAFVSNQTAAFMIAEALGVPRALEVCLFANNVIPTVNGNGYDFVNQRGFEWCVKQLLQKEER